jgi:hypothetical protein
MELRADHHTLVSRLLQSLHFDSIGSRQSGIQSRVGDYGSSFEWIFEPSQAHGFHEWLRTGTGIFWISGKPGSGKSSLVEYIVQHLRPGKEGHALLQDWAQPAEIQVLTFFFFAGSADDLQKNFVGLWRSLCYQLLSEDDALGRDAVAAYDAPYILTKLLQQPPGVHHTWLPADLADLFAFLIGKSQRKHLLLLDGLDESIENHHRLLATIQQLELNQQLRVCYSSRNDEPFKLGFVDCKQIRLQDLTYADIETYVTSRLRGTPAEDLAEDISWKAEGVFLWARLVVDDIEKASHRDDKRQLEVRLLRVRALLLVFHGLQVHFSAILTGC